jgi:UDP-N-acetylglucosamine--N-acetylmuramyl-(pentapeptide) pyrophosphoryl-undecaprenol N-acetylglucosamine transferase
MFPACALAKAMDGRHDVLLITDARGAVFCEDVQRKVVVETVRLSANVAALGRIIKGFFSFMRRWLRNPPDVVVGFGGLCTVIPVLVAAILGAKVVIYEQNAVVGKANRLLSPLSRLKLSFFDIGNGWQRLSPPVRNDFLKLLDVPYQYTPNGILRILVMGGSQGARSFARIIPEALELLDESQRQRVEIIQQAAVAEQEQLRQLYEAIGVKFTVRHFLYNVAEIMAQSQLVICRAGASTLAELTTLGRPAVLVPYPAATNNHQFFNAMNYMKKNAAWLVEEKDDAVEKISVILKKVLENGELLKSAASNMIDTSMSSANDAFVEILEGVAGV